MISQLYKTFSPKLIALAIGVSEASIKRWCDKDVLYFEKTAGGHRRIPMSSVISFLKDNPRQLTSPEVLGLPMSFSKNELSLSQACDQMRQALIAGDENLCFQIAFNLFMVGHKLSAICDQVIALAFHRLGELWQHGDVEIYQERRGVEITRRLLHKFREMLPPPPADAPVAIGATLRDDPYTLPGLMVELCLIENGWRAEFYGCGHPAPTLAAAINDIQPRIVWLNVSAFDSAELFLSDYQTIWNQAELMNVAVVLGGRALNHEIRQQMTYSAFCDTLEHMMTFAQTINPNHNKNKKLES